MYQDVLLILTIFLIIFTARNQNNSNVGYQGQNTVSFLILTIILLQYTLYEI